MIPAYTLGVLVAVRCGLEPAVGTAAIAGVLLYWAAFYALVLDPGERALVRGLLGSAPGRLPAD